MSIVKGQLLEQRNNGFTAIELLVVIAIVLLLVVGASPLYNNLQTSSQLRENTSQIIQTLRTARERSSAGLNDSQHGVFFEINVGADDRYILYQGNDYSSRYTDYDRAITLAPSLSLSTTLTGDETSFTKTFGIPSNIGNVTITHDTDGVELININDLGKIENE